jgi:alkylation response protein AidB-like acyl-CoA dehydrogenase
VDALAILAEAGCPISDPHATYGVWAARSSAGATVARREGDGWHLSGLKPFCSGYGLIDRALVTADTPDGYRLFDISVSQSVVNTKPDSWPAVGMAESQSHTLEFGGPPLAENQSVGDPGFYLDRPGFWFGATGVAACWYGGARALLESLIASLSDTPSDLVLAELGHAVAHIRGMRDILQQAARRIDEDPLDASGTARMSAMVARDQVHHGATEVLHRIAEGGGARPLCHDRAQAQRAADLYVYLAQHHGPQDAAELGRMSLDSRRWI